MMVVMHEKTVCRCGWKPTSTDRESAQVEVEAHRDQHLDGTLPAYDTYPQMPPLPPTDTERIEWLERRLASCRLPGDRFARVGLLKATMGVHIYAPNYSNDPNKFPHATVREAIDAAMQAEGERR